MPEGTPFELPKGLEIDGRTYRQGKIRPLNMQDEIDIAGDPRAQKNPAWKLPVMLCRAITEFEELPVPVDMKKITMLKRSDYLYLANEISKITDEGINLKVRCPACGHEHDLTVDDLLAVPFS